MCVCVCGSIDVVYIRCCERKERERDGLGVADSAAGVCGAVCVAAAESGREEAGAQCEEESIGAR